MTKGESVSALKEQNAQLTKALLDLTAYVGREAFDEFKCGGPDFVEKWRSRRFLDLLRKAEALLPAIRTSAQNPAFNWQPARTAPKAGPGGMPIMLEAVLPDENPREQRIWWNPEIDGGVWMTHAGKIVRPAFWRHIPAGAAARFAELQRQGDQLQGGTPSRRQQR